MGDKDGANGLLLQEVSVLLHVDSARCTGCSICAEVCPTSAIRVVDGIAVIHADLCHECQSCVDACPQGAIRLAEEKVPVVEGEVVNMSQTLPVVQQPASAPDRPASRPWTHELSVALAFLGREIVPRTAAYLLQAWDRKRAASASRRRSADALSLLHNQQAGGHRQRQRQRRGR